MSIQLTLSGHSFSRSDLPKLSTDKQFVEIEVLSSRVVLIPFELFEEVNPVEILAINGITLNENESVVTVPDEQQQIVAALALPDNLIAVAQERYGDNHLFSTPLLRSRICTEPTAWLYLAERIIYIKVWSDGKLRMAEVLPRKKEADTLYYTAAIDAQFDLKRFKIVIEGANGFADEARETAKTLSKYYKKVVCE